MKNLKRRLFAFIVAISLMLGNSGIAYAAGVETWNKGIIEIGSFTFNNENKTPSKTINGTNVELHFGWRRADGLYGSPAGDQGIGDVKLTIQIFDTAGNALTGKYVFYPDEQDDGLTQSEIDLTVPYGQKIRIWMDASSVNPSQSNGKYRAIYMGEFWAFVS